MISYIVTRHTTIRGASLFSIFSLHATLPIYRSGIPLVGLIQGRNAQMNVHRRFCFSLNLFPSIFARVVVHKVKIKRPLQNTVRWSHGSGPKAT